MRSPCPREPPRAALEGFSMHGPARRRPRKTPRDPRCFVCRCYVAHRMLPRPEPALMPSGTTSLRATCTRKLPTPVKLADLLRPLERGPVLLTRRRVDRHKNTVIHACVHPHKVVVMESPNLSVPHQGSSGRESRACARFGDPTRFRRLDRYGRHLTPTSNRHQQGQDKPQQA